MDKKKSANERDEENIKKNTHIITRRKINKTE